MQNNRLDRAKQFMPFDALKGFREALREKEIEAEERALLDEERVTHINRVLSLLKVGDRVRITYYTDCKYEDVELNIKKLSLDNLKIVINNNYYYFDNIRDIRLVN